MYIWTHGSKGFQLQHKWVPCLWGYLGTGRAFSLSDYFIFLFMAMDFQAAFCPIIIDSPLSWGSQQCWRPAHDKIFIPCQGYKVCYEKCMDRKSLSLRNIRVFLKRIYMSSYENRTHYSCSWQLYLRTLNNRRVFSNYLPWLSGRPFVKDPTRHRSSCTRAWIFAFIW